MGRFMQDRESPGEARGGLSHNRLRKLRRKTPGKEE